SFFEKNFLMMDGLLPIGINPLHPFLLSVGFRIFGVSDAVTIATSGVFYLLSALVLYFLGKKVFGSLVGFLAALCFIFSPAMLDLAAIGASESLFILELILAAFLFYKNGKASCLFGFLTLAAMFLTRPSAIIYIVGFIFFFLAVNFRDRRQLFRAGGIFLLSWITLEFVIAKFSGPAFYSPLQSFFYGVTRFSPSVAPTETLRGGMAGTAFAIKPFLTKFFYNLYNYYKLLPEIFSPYLVGFFALSVFHWGGERKQNIFKIAVFLMIATTFIAASAGLPLYRYVHPLTPFIYLFAVAEIVWVVGKIMESKHLGVIPACPESNLATDSGVIPPLAGFPRMTASNIATSFLLIFLFIIGQTIGQIFLDSRYLRKNVNPDKPPVYVKLALILKENTNPADFVVTNLDTWGSWYGERKTVWLPISPEMLKPDGGKPLKIDAVFLTSYKIDDPNHYLNKEWREALLSPERASDKFLTENFRPTKKFKIEAGETYEKESGEAVLWERIKN
ncbi:MAG: glycosyltransferase family 39 protein, partial [bacterium]|nr:glycosyltransferase family 39 protein [bacterium]